MTKVDLISLSYWESFCHINFIILYRNMFINRLILIQLLSQCDLCDLVQYHKQRDFPHRILKNFQRSCGRGISVHLFSLPQGNSIHARELRILHFAVKFAGGAFGRDLPQLVWDSLTQCMGRVPCRFTFLQWNIVHWTNFVEQLVNWTKNYLTSVLFPKGVIKQIVNWTIFDWTEYNWTVKQRSIEQQRTTQPRMANCSSTCTLFDPNQLGTLGQTIKSAR